MKMAVNRRKGRNELEITVASFYTKLICLYCTSCFFSQSCTHSVFSSGTQISCFSPTKFSWRQAAYVDSYCWAAVQTQDTGGMPLWLHKVNKSFQINDFLKKMTL